VYTINVKKLKSSILKNEYKRFNKIEKDGNFGVFFVLLNIPERNNT